MKLSFSVLFALIAPFVFWIGSALSQDMGDFDPFKIEELSAPDSIRYGVDPTGAAPTSKVYSFHIPKGFCSDKKYGDGVSTDCKYNSTRSQMFENVVATKKNGQGQPKSAWYGFSIYFPADGDFGKRQIKGHQSFAYWHNGHCAHLDIKNFAGTEDILALSTSIALGGYDCADGPSLKIAEFKDLLGKWNRFEIYVKWSGGDDGEVQLYLDGKYLINYRGPTLTAGFEKKNYFKFGSYLCCTSNVKLVKEHSVLYAAIKRSQTRDGLWVEEDRKQLKALQGALNNLGCDAGPADGQLSKKVRDAALGCKAFPPGQQPTELSVGSLQSIHNFYLSPAVASLPKGTLPKPAVATLSYPATEVGNTKNYMPVTYEVKGGEALAKKTGDDYDIDSDFTVQVKKNKDVAQIGFIFVGSYSKSTKNLTDLMFILQDGIKGKSGVDLCPGSVETFPDGTRHAKIRFFQRNNIWVATNAKCLIEKLPKKQSKLVEFLATKFSDIAVGMMKSGSAGQIRHEGVKAFVERVALGEIKVQLPGE